MVDDAELKRVLQRALRRAWVFGRNPAFKDLDDRENGEKRWNSYRSARFVQEVTTELSRLTPGSSAKCQGVEATPTLKKSPGEWLLDGAVVKTKQLRDPEKTASCGALVDQILWAIESEYHTSMREFCTDFGKLLNIRAENRLYLNGINQKQADSREKFIERRCRAIEEAGVIKRLGEREGRFFIAFWPTPVAGAWLDYESPEELEEMIQLRRLVCRTRR